jgi:U3 small nucleolar RNA-associated protein 7
MVSAGADYRVKIWDVRNYREIHSYYTQRPTDQVTISDTGLLGIGWGGHVSVVLFTLRSNGRYGKMHFE